MYFKLTVHDFTYILFFSAQTSPYLIDPSGRASQWLKKHLESTEKPFEVTTQEDDRFILTLELAIRFGKTLVIEQVNTISPIIYPILRKDQAGQGNLSINDFIIIFKSFYPLYPPITTIYALKNT